MNMVISWTGWIVAGILAVLLIVMTAISVYLFSWLMSGAWDRWRKGK